MNKRNSNRKLVVGIIVTLFVVILGGIFGLKAYRDYQTNKIYSANDTVTFPGFDFKITSTEFKSVDLPIDQVAINKYGTIDSPEDCDKMSKAPTMSFFGGSQPLPYGPSDFNICIRRNDSRKGIAEYLADNKQFVINYEIMAKNNIRTSDIKISVLVDSGRKLDEQVNTFNGTQFFKDSAQEKINLGGAAVYTPESSYKYIPYYQSELGNDINKGLKRNGYIYTDIRNNEKSIDLKITYKQNNKENVRIIRINR